MPMDVAEILPGKCYLTDKKERYAVVTINSGIVTYQSWTKGDNKMSLRTNTGVKNFAAAVVKQIACPPVA